MKKLLTLFSITLLTLNIAVATEAVTQPATTQQQSSRMAERAQRIAAFEKRLELTEEQKVQAKELRLKGHEKLRPIMETIQAKKQEAKMVKLSRISVQMQEEKLAKIDEELKVLEKKAHDIRTQNMREFESILTRKQKKILKEMKKEGRQRYNMEHCPHK